MTTSPAISLERKDPMPAAALGMWLFLAGEAMFFAGLLSAYIVLQSVPGERALFLRSARVVNLPMTIVAGALLAGSAFAVWRRANGWIIAGLAVAFLLAQGWTCERLLTHRTVVTAGYVYDGRWTLGGHFYGVRMPQPASLDLAQMMPGDIAGTPANWDVYLGEELAYSNYGPSRNNYFACYFLVTAAHLLHVVGGLIALAWLAARRRLSSDGPQRVLSLYWQFVNGVGLLSLVLLSLG